MTNNLESLTLDVSQGLDISASVEVVWQNLLRRLSTDNSAPDGAPMPMILEATPGGRWFRDLGDDQGHLWGHVQVIKAPHLLEIQGPMFMSYPVASHIQFRVDETDGGATLSLHHRAFGLIDDQHREGVVPGWKWLLERTKAMSEIAPPEDATSI